MFILLPASFLFAQTTVFAYLKDANGKPVENAEIDLKGSGNDVKADKIGYFQFVDLKSGHYQIVITKPNYETKVMEFDVNEEKRKDLGVITLYSSLTGADQGLAIIENSGDEENSSQGSTVGLLQSSQDVFSRIAAFDLGAYWFRPRGIDGRTGETMMNGISMVKSDNGNVDFSNWGGLNEITRYPETAANHSPSEYAFGGASGVIFKNTNASDYRKGFQATYSLTNRNYRNRASLRYSSGMSRSGWAVTAMFARRWAQEGIQEGTFYDAYGGFLGIEKKFSDSHTVTLNAFASPYRRSTSSPSTQEVYNYRGVHYNSYWGWQDGEKRSERVREGFQPIIQLQDFWKINKNSSLTTAISYQFGKDKSARLDWQGIQNPSPTYYRRLPSYYSSLDPTASVIDPLGNQTTAQDAYQTSLEGWKNGADFTQLDWARFYRINRNHQNYEFGYGTPYYVKGNSALVYQVNDVTDEKIWNAGTHYVYNFSDTSKFILNLAYQNYKSELYREVKDLLGADYVLNRDPFAATNQPGKSGLFNEGETDVTKRVGDRLGYNYILSRQEVKINPAFKFQSGRFDVFVSGSAAYSTSAREGLFRHYLYADSYGKSQDYEFYNFGLKGQVVFKLDGRNFLVYNGAAFSQAPFLEDLFFNPRVNSSVTPNIKNAFITANDLSYVLNSPFIKMRLSGFLVDTQNDTNVQRFFADGIQLETTGEDGTTNQVQSAFVTEVMSNVNKRNMGVEVGIDVKVLPTLSLQGVASYGNYTYQNNPNVYYASDAAGTFDGGKTYLDMGKSYLKGYKQGGTAQQGYSLGFRYNSPKFWWFGANWNYLDDNYLAPSSITRSERFIQNTLSGTPYVGVTEETLREALQPIQLPSTFFLNANVGKSWRFGSYYVMITASVNNILDNKKYITGGFEQTRNVTFPDFVEENNREFPLFSPKYWYNQGRQYFINLQVRF